MKKRGVGIIGCGNISNIYLKNLTAMFDNVAVVACADLDESRARAQAEAHPGVKALGIDELLGSPEIDIVVNLTVPQAHNEVARKALEAGKSVYGEKPLTLAREDAKSLIELAAEKGLLVGAAPDTFLGGGIQTCIGLIESGAIGELVGAQAFMLSRGPENWHPDPEFFYMRGGGPMFDMGPYYLTALVAMLGPATRVTGSTRISFPTRTITSAKKKGQTMKVEIPTHVAGTIDFANGAIGTIATSFDVCGSDVPWIEVFGSEGTLSVPDPNTFHGPVRLRKMGAGHWDDIPLAFGFAGNSRGVGVADMAAALDEGRAPRASGELAYHVLDIMHSIHDASELGRHVTLESGCARPASLKGESATSRF